MQRRRLEKTIDDRILREDTGLYILQQDPNSYVKNFPVEGMLSEAAMVVFSRDSGRVAFPSQILLGVS